MTLQNIIGLLSSYRTLIISDYDTQEELKVYPACDIRIGSPFEHSDILKAIDRDKAIMSEYGEFEVMHITCDHSCLYVDVKGVI